jgi:hypothetical protein
LNGLNGFAGVRKDAPRLPASPRLCRTSAVGCFTLEAEIKAMIFIFDPDAILHLNIFREAINNLLANPALK